MKNLTKLMTVLTCLVFYTSVHAQTSFNISNKTTGDTLFTIDNDGKVGIGTTTPAVSFDVVSSAEENASSMYLRNSNDTHWLYLYGGRGGGSPLGPGFYWQEGDPLRFTSFGAQYNEYMRISDIGNVGIGTDNPFAKLDIQMSGSGLWQRGIRLLNPELETGNQLMLTLGAFDNTNNSGNIYFNYQGDGSLQNRLSLGLYAVDDVLNIMADGNVGIGTTSPSTQLEVAGTIQSNSGGFMFPDGSVQTSAAETGAGNTLDEAYDQGGAGSGRVITADAGAFEVGGTDGVLFSGIHDSGTLPVEGSGTRMIWYPRKSAFRAGWVGGTQWDDANIGHYSMALGYNTLASNSSSTALGYSTTASGANSMAVGRYATAGGANSMAVGDHTTASGRDAIAMGNGTVASYFRSTAMGYRTVASSIASTAMGDSTKASGITSTAMGYYTNASGEYSTAMGNNTTASGITSTAMGWSTMANGNYSTAMGLGTTASDWYATAMGYRSAGRSTYTVAIGNSAKAIHAGSIVIAANSSGTYSDSIFTGGNEQMVFRADGGIYITNSSGAAPYDISRLINTSTGGYLSSGGAWTDASSRDFKENISELSTNQAIDAFNHLTPVTYNYKVDSEEKCVGFIAEDVPDIVATKDRKGLSSMDIVARLTKVVQNQQSEIDWLKQKIEQIVQLNK